MVIFSPIMGIVTAVVSDKLVPFVKLACMRDPHYTGALSGSGDTPIISGNDDAGQGEEKPSDVILITPDRAKMTNPT